MKRMGINVNIYGSATIRHAAISFWCANGISREEVARRTGHRSLNIISFYYDKSEAKDISMNLQDKLLSIDKNELKEDEESDEEIEDGSEEELAQEI